jgi:hypothetical protein
VGRWICVDPLEEFWDSYSYGPNDPINGIDNGGNLWQKKVFDRVTQLVGRAIAKKECHTKMRDIVRQANWAQYEDLSQKILEMENIDEDRKGDAIYALYKEFEAMEETIKKTIPENARVGDYSMLKMISNLPKTISSGNYIDLGGVVVPMELEILPQGKVIPGSESEMIVTNN